MKMTLAFVLLSFSMFGCVDYPQHEPPLTDTDIHVTGPGEYGGIESPTNNNTTTPTSNISTTQTS
jgi:hypothetical protein